jgi:hypothetical protein
VVNRQAHVVEHQPAVEGLAEVLDPYDDLGLCRRDGQLGHDAVGGNRR